MNLLSLSRIYFGFFFREFSIDSLFFSWIHYQFTIFSRTHYESFNFSRIDPEFTISFANSLSIHYLFRESTMNSLCFRELTMNPLIFSRIHFEFTIFFVFTLWIHYLLRQFVTLSVSRLIHYFFRKFSLYLLSLREITMDPISFREFTIYFFMLYDEITTWQLNNN